jgi:membrane protease YdiL (CAAX protease family)
MKTISPSHAVAIFVGFTAYFFLLLFTLHPFLAERFAWNPVLNWFVTGYFLFIPIFAHAVLAVRNEGRNTIPMILEGLNIRAMNATDWKYAIAGLLIVFALTGVIFGVSFALHSLFGVRELSTQPWFVNLSPLQGSERLLLLVWLPMFFFNIAGEEILWRGYIQARISARNGWLVCAGLWWMFHLPFGLDLMIMLLPITIVVPYVFYKTRSTLACVFIHGVYNGPLFVAVALGAMA